MFQELATDLRKVMSTKYRKVKPNVIKTVRDSGLSVIELKHIEDNPDYLNMFDESSESDVKLVYSYAKILADAMPDDINLDKYFNQDAINAASIESYLLFQNAYRIAENQYACSVSVKQAVKLFRANKINVKDNLWTINRRTKRQKESICDGILAGSYYYKAVYCMIDRLKFDAESHTILIGSSLSVIDGDEQIEACSALYENSDSIASPFINDIFPLIIYIGNDIIEMVGESGRGIPSKSARFIMSYVADPANGLNAKLANNFSSMNNGAFNIRIMSDRVDMYYTLADQDLTEIAKWIVEYFNEFANIFPEDTANIRVSTKFRVLFSSMSNVWHIYLSSLLYYDKKDNPDFDWKTVMKKTLDIDWSNNGELAKSVPGMCSGYRDIIETFFRKRYDDVKKQSV